MIEVRADTRPHLLIEKLDTYAGPEEFEPAHVGDAGIDLYAAENVSVSPGELQLVKCGIKLAIPRGMEGQIRPKSGRALKQGMVVLNSPGTIDEGYRGEIMVLVQNARVMTKDDWYDVKLAVSGNDSSVQSDLERLLDQVFHHNLKTTFSIGPGDKIAQIVFSQYERPPVRYVQGVDQTERGEDGFGSTGVSNGLQGGFGTVNQLVDVFAMPQPDGHP